MSMCGKRNWLQDGDKVDSIRLVVTEPSLNGIASSCHQITIRLRLHTQ